TADFIANQLQCSPGKGRVEYCDTDLPGLYIEVRATSPGEGTYYLRYKNDGGKTCHTKIGRSIDKTLLEARKQARQLKAEGIAFDGPLIISDSPNIKSKAYVRRDPAEGSGLMAAFNEMRSDLLTRKMTEMDVANLPENNSGGLKAAIKRSPLYGFARIARTQIRLLKMHRAAERGCKVPMDARSFYCGQMMHWALRKYKCHTYDGDILFFRSGAHGHEMHIGGWWRDTFLGCSEICSGKFNGHILGGGHDEILKRPELAQHVRKTFSS
uniref:Arm DNA-binding domain-containing protein n=1 Tax=Pontiella sp. TaxID=2837462 RepID=UPI003567720C